MPAENLNSHPVDAMTSDLDVRLAVYRKGLLARLWAGGAFIAVIGLATSVSGALSGRPYFTLTTPLALAFIAAYLLRKRIPYATRVAATLAVLFGVGLANFVQVGMFGAGYLWFVIGAWVAAMLYSVRAGMISLALSTVVLLLVGVGFINGSITPPYDFNSQAADPIQWILFFTTVILMSSLMLYVVGGYIASIQGLLLEVHAQGEQTRQALENLTQTQAQVVQLEKLASLGSLVAGVAHELNTPIGNVMLSISAIQDRQRTMKDAIDRGELRRSTLDQFFVDTIELTDLAARSSRRAAGLVSSFKQIAVDQTSVQRRQFLLQEVIDDVLATLTPTYRDTPWEISASIPPLKPADSYPGPLGHVITNLVQNALIHAFVGRQTGTVWITAVGTAESAIITVRDNGVGMDTGTLSLIFDPFFTTRLGQGTSGLGLSVAHNIAVGVLGGTLKASSTPNEGTCFFLTIPLVAPVVA